VQVSAWRDERERGEDFLKRMHRGQLKGIPVDEARPKAHALRSSAINPESLARSPDAKCKTRTAPETSKQTMPRKLR
jgi:hypothetical protein